MIEEIVESTKVATFVSATTTGAGVSTIFEWVPDDIGKLASLVGIILSVVLIYFHIRKIIIDEKVNKINMKMLEAENKRLRNSS